MSAVVVIEAGIVGASVTYHRFVDLARSGANARSRFDWDSFAWIGESRRRLAG
jgi:hypothetical protein